MSKQVVDFGGWETAQERAIKHMKIPPLKKMEWLYQMHEFTLAASSKRMRKMRMKLREKQSLG